MQEMPKTIEDQKKLLESFGLPDPTTMPQDEIRKISVMWYLVDCLPKVRVLSQQLLPEGFEVPADSPLRYKNIVEGETMGRLSQTFNGKTQLDLVSEECSQISSENALQYPSFTQAKKTKKNPNPQSVMNGYSVPSWRLWVADKELSGLYIIALMVACLWVKCGEDEEMVSSLCDFWPIKDAVALCSQLEAKKQAAVSK